MSFEQGHPKYGGRKKGQLSGRAKALAKLGQILGKDENLETLERELQTAFDSNPIKFLEDYGIALAPKGSIGDSAVEGVRDTPAEFAEMHKATVGDKPDDVASTEIPS